MATIYDEKELSTVCYANITIDRNDLSKEVHEALFNEMDYDTLKTNTASEKVSMFYADDAVKEHIKEKIMDGNDFGFLKIDDDKSIRWDLDYDIKFDSFDIDEMDFHDLSDDSKERIVDCVLEHDTNIIEINELIDVEREVDIEKSDGVWKGEIYIKTDDDGMSLEMEDYIFGDNMDSREPSFHVGGYHYSEEIIPLSLAKDEIKESIRNDIMERCENDLVGPGEIFPIKLGNEHALVFFENKIELLNDTKDGFTAYKNFSDLSDSQKNDILDCILNDDITEGEVIKPTERELNKDVDKEAWKPEKKNKEHHNQHEKENMDR